MKIRNGGKHIFRMVELGTVKRGTKGIFLLLVSDGGEWPFSRELPIF